MDRRYQVFISSTYTDLVEERREVIQALLEMDCIPAGMEMFPAGNDDQWTLIQEVIDQSDYYLVIVGGRYGSTTEEGISYTEKEYDYAISQGVPVMGFVHAHPNDIPIGKSEIAPPAREKLDAFRAKVMTRMVKSYTSPPDLGSVVSRGLSRLIKRHPRDGWVRGNYAMTPETRAELAELRAALAVHEKVRAEERVTRSERQGLNLEFNHGDDEVVLKVEYIDGPAWGRESHIREVTYQWDEIIEALGPFMIDEAPETQLRETLNAHILGDIAESGDGPSELDSAPQVNILDASWGTIVVQLRALHMIRTGTKKRTASDKAVYWTLTEAGDDYLVGLRATRRSGLAVNAVAASTTTEE